MNTFKNWSVIAVISSAILFCSKAILIKLAYLQDIDPIVLMTLRMMFSIPFFMAVFIREKGFYTQMPRIKGQDHLLILLMGLLGYYLASYLDFLGLKYIPASIERIILYLYPIFVAVLSFFFFREKIHNGFWIALGFCYIGLLLLFSDAASIAGFKWNGALAVAFSALAYAVFLIINGKVVHRIGPKRLATLAMLYSCGAVFVHFSFTQSLTALKVSLSVYVLAGLIAVFSTVIPVYLLNYGMRSLGASRVAALSTIGPVSTVGLGWVFLGERLNFIQLCGIGVVLMAGFYFGKGKK